MLDKFLVGRKKQEAEKMIFANLIKEYPELKELNYKETPISEVLGEIGFVLKEKADLKFVSADEYAKMEIVAIDEPIIDEPIVEETVIEEPMAGPVIEEPIKEPKPKKEEKSDTEYNITITKRSGKGGETERKEIDVKTEHPIDEATLKDMILKIDSSVKSKYKKMMSEKTPEQLETELAKLKDARVDNELDTEAIKDKIKIIDKILKKDASEIKQDEEEVAEEVEEGSEEVVETSKIEAGKKEKKETKKDKEGEVKDVEPTKEDKKEAEKYISMKETYDTEDKATKRIKALEKKGYIVVHLTKLTKIDGTERKHFWEIEAQKPLVPSEDTKLENEKIEKLELVDEKRGTDAGDKIKPMAIGDTAKKLKPMAVGDAAKSVKPIDKDGKAKEVKQLAIKADEMVEFAVGIPVELTEDYEYTNEAYENTFDNEVATAGSRGEVVGTGDSIDEVRVYLADKECEVSIPKKCLKQCVNASEKIEAIMSNGTVIDAYLSDEFPKKDGWGSRHLYVKEERGHWGLMNYSTYLLFRIGGEVYYNAEKYSVTTSKIQSWIRSAAESAGIELNECEESDIQALIDAIPNEEPSEELAPAVEPKQIEEATSENEEKVESSKKVKAGYGCDFDELTPEQQKMAIKNFFVSTGSNYNDFESKEALIEMLKVRYDWDSETCKPIGEEGFGEVEMAPSMVESKIMIDAGMDFEELAPEQQEKCMENFLRMTGKTMADFGTKEKLIDVMTINYDWDPETCQPIMYEEEEMDWKVDVFGFDLKNFAQAYYELREGEPNDPNNWDIFKTGLGYAVYRKGSKDTDSFAGDFSAFDLDNFFAEGWENSVIKEEPALGEQPVIKQEQVPMAASVEASAVKVETGSPTTVEVKVENNQLNIKVGTTEIKTPSEGTTNIVIQDTAPAGATTTVTPPEEVPPVGVKVEETPPAPAPAPIDTTVEAPVSAPAPLIESVDPMIAEAQAKVDKDNKIQEKTNEINNLLAEWYAYDDSPTGKVVKDKIKAKIVEVETSINALKIVASEIKAAPEAVMEAPTSAPSDKQMGEAEVPTDEEAPAEATTETPTEDTVDMTNGIAIGEGYIAHKDDENNEIYVLDKEGTEIMRVHNGFKNDTVEIVDTFRDLLNIPDPEPTPEAPGEEVPSANVEQKLDEINQKLDEVINIKKGIAEEGKGAGEVGEGEEQAGEGEDRDETNDEELIELKKEIDQKKQQVDKILQNLNVTNKIVISRKDMQAGVITGEDPIFTKKRIKQAKLKALAKKLFAMDNETLSVLENAFINNTEIKGNNVSSILMFLNN